jgi:RNA polymerase sigma factor (sigma-70 family)
MAEDAAQAVFIILARRAESITQQTRLSGWLFNTARFVVKDARKQQARYRRREDVARELAADRMAPKRPPVSADTQSALDDALATLTERDRQALLMHFYEGLSLNEMAEVLEIGKEGVKKRVGRALGRLRARLGSKRTPVATLLALVVLLRSRAASALPAGLHGSVVTGATTSGQASILAQWMARQGMQAAAGASGRLLRAALAAEVVAAVTIVGSWALPKSQPPAAVAPGQVALVTPTTPLWTAPVTVSNAGQTGANGAQSAKPYVTTTSNEPAYRSGADDPEPKITLTPAGPRATGAPAAPIAPAPAADAPRPVASSNTIYAGVAPVQRNFETATPPPPIDVRRSLPAPSPIAVGGGGGGDTAPASAPVATATIRPSSSSATASNARPPRSEDMTPAGERIVAQCVALLPHAGQRPHDEMDAWFDRPDHFDAANQDANPKISGANRPDPAELAMNDDDRAGHMRRMFIADGDHPINRHWGDRFEHHGLHPYITVADEDPATITGACPRTTAQNAALASSFADLTAAHAHHWHHDSGDGLCAPPMPPSALPPLTPAGAASDFAIAGSFQAVPEPGTIGFAGLLLSIAGLRRRRRRR